MAIKTCRHLVCDFETTVYEGQEYTEVWAAACVEMYTDDVKIFHSISDLYDYLVNLKCNIVLYLHNLKFDGAFWLSYLLVDLKYKQAYYTTGDIYTARWQDDRDMPSNSFKYCISDMGQWYSITIKKGRYTIEIRDSLKLLPFSVKRIGDSFGTKHKKLDMEYKGFRFAGCQITEEERRYIANDVLVVKEALELMYDEGHTKLTIGSCCLSEFKKGLLMGIEDYRLMFPNLYEIAIDEGEHGYPTAGDYIHRSYKGGWCYLVKGKGNHIFHNGTTADVNSLYPSVMSGESGNIYPCGRPTFWIGDGIPDEAKGTNKYFFVRIRCKFRIKSGYLPFIQIKNNLLYPPTEALESSDVYDKATGTYHDSYVGPDGTVKSTRQELVLTMTDYKLFLEHYDVSEYEIVDGCWFFAQCGIFDTYIDKYRKIKLSSKGAKRELAKLFLNNLYGKMASSPDSSFKLAVEKDDHSIGFISISAHEKEPGYIPIGSAITSYARDFTIRAAQKNYHGKDKRGFIYADTDSIHCDLEPGQLQGIKVHDSDFCCWKLESCWDTGYFTRQKTYIEHVVMEDLEPVTPYYNIRCAGMPKKCKDLFELSMRGDQVLEDFDVPEEIDFLFDDDGNPIHRTMEDFKVGLKVPGKLMPKRIKGGIVLVDTFYEMR